MKSVREVTAVTSTGPAPLEIRFDEAGRVLRLATKLALNTKIDELVPRGAVRNQQGALVGEHPICGGSFFLRQISESHAMVYCDVCRASQDVPMRLGAALLDLAFDERA